VSDLFDFKQIIIRTMQKNSNLSAWLVVGSYTAFAYFQSTKKRITIAWWQLHDPQGKSMNPRLWKSTPRMSLDSLYWELNLLVLVQVGGLEDSFFFTPSHLVMMVRKIRASQTCCDRWSKRRRALTAQFLIFFSNFIFFIRFLSNGWVLSKRSPKKIISPMIQVL